MSDRNKRLSPLWMERLETVGFEDHLRFAGLGGLNWASLMREADRIRSQIDAGTPWSLVDVLKSLRHPSVMKASAERLQYFDPESLLGFLGLPSIIRGMFALDALLTQNGASVEVISNTLETVTHELYHLTRFKHYGQKIYVLDKVTYDLLLNTDLPDVPLRYMRPPVPEFYLVLPEGHGVTIDVGGDVQPVEGLMVSFPDLDDTRYKLNARELSVLVTGRSSYSGADDNLSFLSAVATGDISINDFVTHNFQGHGPKFSDLLHVLFGIILYLASEHPALEPVPPLRTDIDSIRSPKKRAKAERKLQRHTRFGYVRIRTEPTRTEATPRTGRQLDHPVWVRGHWRHQPYGKGRKLRKWIWIQPYQRGPDIADTVKIRLAKVQTAQRSGQN